jgi:glycerophosphoryl diester phosphodiesterase
LLVAHRGGSALAPENTLPAFRQALEWWSADVLELDVNPTRDGEAVVIHDTTLDRTTSHSGPVSGRTLAELREVDAGYRFSADRGATFPYRGRGIRIPTFAEVLAAFPHTRINVEIKDGRVQERLRELIHEASATHRVLVAAGRHRDRSRFKRYEGPLSASARELRAFFALHLIGLSHRYAPEVDAFQIPERYAGRQVLSPGFVRAAHDHNVPVHVWTVDEEPDMRRLLDWGVDGIITDRPDRLAKVLHEKCGRTLPPGADPNEVPPSVERLLRG